MRNRETEAATETQRIENGNSALPDVINHVLPEGMRNHPLVSGKWFYTLPSMIWVELCNALGRDCFDADVLELEIAASQQAESIGGCVGFHNGVPIYDFHLRPVPPIDFTAPAIQQYFAECRAAGYKTPTSNGLINKKLDALKMPQKAYLGWLLTCPSFLTELQELRTEFREVFDCGQSPHKSLQFSTDAEASASSQWLQPADDPTAQAVSAFCRRWRIGNIVGPVSFRPLSIQFPVALPMRAAIDTQSSGSLLYMPDIAPVPNRDLLEQLVEEVVRQTIQRAPHLAEWVELAHGGKLGRKKLNHFAKAYELQHFIRVLYARHGDRLNRQQTKIYQVIGAYLEINSDQMLRTMQRIRRRLGKDWLTPESLLLLHR